MNSLFPSSRKNLRFFSLTKACIIGLHKTTVKNKLIESGFEYVTEVDGVKLFKKKKIDFKKKMRELIILVEIYREMVRPLLIQMA
jgi:hypothetical protein